MTQRPDLSNPFSNAFSSTNLAQHPFRAPAVRHLAWVCHGSQLISSPLKFDLQDYLPADVEARLMAWDEAPENGPAMLTEPPAKRLGHYFERLYECLMTDLLGWEILLKNQPVRHNGITLGELDFILRNPVDGAVEHHEVAVKFYLGYPETVEHGPLWYGPNARDRLDLKTRRLTNHQSQLTLRAETKDLLASLGIETPVRPRIFMPGYLFYPQQDKLPAPEGVATNHCRGHWMYIDELDQSLLAGQHDTHHWVPLNKPHWLGPWRQETAPDHSETDAALEMVRVQNIPRLFAVLAPRQHEAGWHEIGRVFVMHRSWPEPRRSG